ncbi:MAG TPA: DNA mismatch repair endonuclease MutL [Dissulfurispiraceae bacterium]|nr:DNA mismatch repair endonuclease MutL [Dissulfurispiraceae bacterium]
MNVIKVLPLLLRNKIAAGEVIERPASVVKELLENSIDAGSTRIEITISGAGKKLIRISDNGSGMGREDALLAFERYATSKIDSEEDLFNIRSMGFRGEALSSIAAVSKVRLVTARKENGLDDNQTGICIEISGGEVRSVKDCPASGTVIEVKDLFFNTPARRKFLKSDNTENYHIIDAVTREAIPHFDIGFVLMTEGEETLSLPPAASPRERIMQVYGKSFVDGMIETSSEETDYSLRAFIGKASNVRSSRNSQFLFINRRPVKDQAVNHAIYKAYEDLIPRDKHPVFFIFLEIDPERVDVNVHPAKREVRFEDKTGVYNFVLRTCRDAIRGAAVDFVSEAPEGERIGGQYSIGFPPQTSDMQRRFFTREPGSAADMISEAAGQSYGTAYGPGVASIYIGETFVAFPSDGGLTLLDYHAAHERVNYERLLKKSGLVSHRLLFPQQAKVGPKEYRIILGNLQLLSDFGIEAEDFGHRTIIVRSLPEMLKDADVRELLNDVAACMVEEGSQLSASPEPLESVRKSVAARMACHSSIRGKEVPDGVRISELVKSLGLCEEPDRCPHGRPTRIFISTAELKKMFRK